MDTYQLEQDCSEQPIIIFSQYFDAPIAFSEFAALYASYHVCTAHHHNCSRREANGNGKKIVCDKIVFHCVNIV